MAGKTVQITIEGNNITAIKAIDGVETKLKTMGTTGGSAFSKLDSTLGAFGLSLNKIAIGALVGGFAALVKNSIDLGAELNDMSKKTGVSVEQLSTLKYAADQSGTSLEGMNTSLRFFNKNIYDAANGGKETGDAFRALGVPVKDAAGNLLSADEAMYKVADKFMTMPDGVEKTALALKVFGKRGSDMIPILNEGSAAIIKMQEEAAKLGLQMSTKTAKEMDEIKDTITRLEGSVKGLAMTFISALGEPVAWVLRSLAEGLEVVFGKVELINGVQFRAPVMGLAAMNEHTKSLIGSSKEYRAELINNMQAQIAVNLGNQLEAEYKLQTLNTQLGILTLLTDEDDIQEQKVRTAKATVAALTQQLDIIKQFGTAAKNTGLGLPDTSEAIAKAKKLKEATDEINYQVTLFGLSEADIKMAELINKAKKWKAEYGTEMPQLSLQAAIIQAERYGKEMAEILKKTKAVDDLTAQLQLEISPDGLNDADKAIIKLQKEAVKFREILGDNSPLVDQWLLTQSEEAIREYYAKIKIIREKDADDADQIRNEELWKRIDAEYQGLMVISDIMGSMGDIMQVAYSTGGAAAESAFNAYKAFAIAYTIISTYAAAQKAYESQFLLINPASPFLATAAAAAAIVGGMARLAVITSTRPSLSGSVSNVGGGASGGSYPTSGSGARSVANQYSNNNVSQKPNITFIINGDVINVDDWMRRNSGSINKAIKDGLIDFGNN